MKYLITLFLLITISGCAVNSKSTYINPQYNKKIDSISFSWADINFIYKIQKTAQGYTPTITNQDKYNAQTAAHKAISNIKNNYQKIFTKYFKDYGIEIIDSSTVKLTISTTPSMDIQCFDSVKGGFCTPKLDMVITLYDTETKTRIWSGTARIVDYNIKGKKDADGNLLEGEYSVVDDFAIEVIKMLESEKLARRVQ